MLFSMSLWQRTFLWGAGILIGQAFPGHVHSLTEMTYLVYAMQILQLDEDVFSTGGF